MNLEEVELEGSDDSSDEDFIPAGVGEVASEESDSGDEEGDGSGNEEDATSRKRTRNSSSRKTKKRKKSSKVKEETVKEEEKENSKENDVLTEEEKKKKSDSLWADFLKDCGPPAKKSLSGTPELKSGGTEKKTESPSINSPKPEVKPQEPKKITQILTFAGEEVRIEKEVKEVKSGGSIIGSGTPGRGRGRSSGGGGGIGGLLSQLGKKNKLSTLEKSKLDWERFKDQEGITEELTSHNKGKDGFLERQDFLERTDLRQFEIEKAMRNQRRSLNNR